MNERTAWVTSASAASGRGIDAMIARHWGRIINITGTGNPVDGGLRRDPF